MRHYYLFAVSLGKQKLNLRQGISAIMSLSAHSSQEDPGAGIMPASYRQRSLQLLGLLCFAIGTVGIVLPVLPTTIFWILAVYCFGKSSPELRERILSHPRLGATIRGFVDHGVIPRKAKQAALLGILGSFLLSALVLPVVPLLLLLLLLTAVVAYIVSRPE